MNVVNLDIILLPRKRDAGLAPVAFLLQGWSHQLREEGQQGYLTGDARFRASLVQGTAGKTGHLGGVIQLGVWEWESSPSLEEKTRLLARKLEGAGLDPVNYWRLSTSSSRSSSTNPSRGGSTSKSSAGASSSNRSTTSSSSENQETL